MTSLAPNDKTGEDGSREKQEESIKKRAPGPGSQGPGPRALGPWRSTMILPLPVPLHRRWEFDQDEKICIEDENWIIKRLWPFPFLWSTLHLLQKNKTSFHICLLRPNGYQIWTFLCMHYWQKCRPLDSWSHERVNYKDVCFFYEIAPLIWTWKSVRMGLSWELLSFRQVHSAWNFAAHLSGGSRGSKPQ